MISMHEISTGLHSHRKFVGVAYRLRHCALHAALPALLVLGLTFAGSVAAHDDPDIHNATALINEHPGRTDPVLKRGQMYRMNGEFKKALADVDRAQRMDPGNRQITMERARVLSALGRNTEAEKELDRLVEDENRDVKLGALAERAAVRAKLGRKEAAIEDLDKVIEEQPALQLYLSRGEILVDNGQLAEAAAGYREGLARLGSSGFLLNQGLIRVVIAREHYNEAKKLASEQIDQAQVKTPWLLLLAKIYRLMEQPEDAQRALTDAMSEANRVLAIRATATNHLYLAKVLDAMGMTKKANCELQEIVKQAPHLEEARELLESVGRGVSQTCTD